MPQPEGRCADCGRPVEAREVCAACEQDRVMQQAQAGYSVMGRGLRCND